VMPIFFNGASQNGALMNAFGKVTYLSGTSLTTTTKCVLHGVETEDDTQMDSLEQSVLETPPSQQWMIIRRSYKAGYDGYNKGIFMWECGDDTLSPSQLWPFQTPKVYHLMDISQYTDEASLLSYCSTTMDEGEETFYFVDVWHGAIEEYKIGAQTGWTATGWHDTNLTVRASSEKLIGISGVAESVDHPIMGKSYQWTGGARYNYEDGGVGAHVAYPLLFNPETASTYVKMISDLGSPTGKLQIGEAGKAVPLLSAKNTIGRCGSFKEKGFIELVVDTSGFDDATVPADQLDYSTVITPKQGWRAFLKSGFITNGGTVVESEDGNSATVTFGPLPLGMLKSVDAAVDFLPMLNAALPGFFQSWQTNGLDTAFAVPASR
jgi:hypothetical protein